MKSEEFRALTPENRRQLVRGERGERKLLLERKGGIDEKARTAWLSIASEAPYERWWGTEILSVEPGAIRDGRLKSGAPLLVGHNTADQVGVIERYEITDNNRLRVQVRFSRSARAEEVFQDVLDGIRLNTSVGYLIHDLEAIGSDDNGMDIFRVTDWEPLEGSIVAVPADPSVGVSRSYTTTRAPIGRAPIREERMENENRELINAEADRIRAIVAAGETYKDQELARELATDPKATVETFKSRYLERQRGAQRPLGHGGDIAIPYGQGARVRFGYGGALKAFKDLPIEGGGVMKAEEAAYRSGVWLAASVGRQDWAIKKCRDIGMPVLYRDSNDRIVNADPGGFVRAQNENVLSAGAALVPIEMEAAVIMLRDKYGAARQICRIRGMNSDTLKVPRRKSGVTAYFFQDDDGVGMTESSKLWDNVTLSTKKLGCLTKTSRDLVEDSVINVVDDLANEMAYAFAVKEDQCLLIGDGTSTYGGMQGMNTKFESTAYISRTALATGHDTMAEVDNTDVTTVMGGVASYADSPQAVFLCSNFFKHGIFNRLKATAGGNRVDTLGQSPDNTYLGYQIVTSEAMPKVTTTLLNKVMFLFGRFDMAASLGARRGIELQTLVERYAELGQIGVIATERFDIVVHDLGTTSSSDVNGGRGPVSAAFGA